MPEGEVFVDTVALLALVNRDDELHEQSTRVLRELTTGRIPLVTSDWVLAEFLGGAARPPLRHAAVRAIERVRSSNRVSILPATREDWDESFDLFRQRLDKLGRSSIAHPC